MDYYGSNEKVVTNDGETQSQGPMLGWHAIARDYYDCYNRPLMLTETNAIDKGNGESVHWLKQAWSQAHHVRTHGIAMIGFTWYSLTDQIDWDIQITQIKGNITPNGLCTLDRKLRKVGQEFKLLAHNNVGSQLIQGVPNALLTH